MRLSDSKVHGANMRPTRGQQDPGGPHVGLVNFAICVGKGLSANLFQAISWTSADMWSIGRSGTSCCKIGFKVQTIHST